MSGINERIKHAETLDEVQCLLGEGAKQENADSHTLNRRKKIAERRIFNIRQKESDA